MIHQCSLASSTGQPHQKYASLQMVHRVILNFGKLLVIYQLTVMVRRREYQQDHIKILLLSPSSRYGIQFLFLYSGHDIFTLSLSPTHIVFTHNPTVSSLSWSNSNHGNHAHQLISFKTIKQRADLKSIYLFQFNHNRMMDIH